LETISSVFGRFGHVEQRDGTDWVKRCITTEVDGVKQRKRPSKTWFAGIKEDMKSFVLQMMSCNTVMTR